MEVFQLIGNGTESGDTRGDGFFRPVGVEFEDREVDQLSLEFLDFRRLGRPGDAERRRKIVAEYAVRRIAELRDVSLRFRPFLDTRKPEEHPAFAAVAAISVCACVRSPAAKCSTQTVASTVTDYLDGEGHSGLDRSTLGGSDAKEMFVHGSGATCTTSLQPELLVGDVLLRGLWNGDVNVDVGFVQGVGLLPVLISRRARLLRSAASRSSGAANITTSGPGDQSGRCWDSMMCGGVSEFRLESLTDLIANDFYCHGHAYSKHSIWFWGSY